MDVVLPSDDDDAAHQPEPDAPVNRKILGTDDAGDVGVTSAEAIIPSQIGASAPSNPRSSIVDLVSVVPPTRGRGRKRPPITVKRFNHVPRDDQVMFQVELPPFPGPHSLLDLVAIEIVFGCIFEAFHQMSQATDVDAAPADDNKPLQKRHRRVPTKKEDEGTEVF
jgi:hypothetical protein